MNNLIFLPCSHCKLLRKAVKNPDTCNNCNYRKLQEVIAEIQLSNVEKLKMLEEIKDILQMKLR